jgi:hypothetical protein
VDCSDNGYICTLFLYGKDVGAWRNGPDGDRAGRNSSCASKQSSHGLFLRAQVRHPAEVGGLRETSRHSDTTLTRARQRDATRRGGRSQNPWRVRRFNKRPDHGSTITRNPTSTTFCHGWYARRNEDVARVGRSHQEPPRTAFRSAESASLRPSSATYG